MGRRPPHGGARSARPCSCSLWWLSDSAPHEASAAQAGDPDWEVSLLWGAVRHGWRWPLSKQRRTHRGSSPEQPNSALRASGWGLRRWPRSMRPLRAARGRRAGSSARSRPRWCSRGARGQRERAGERHANSSATATHQPESVARCRVATWDTNGTACGGWSSWPGPTARSRRSWMVHGRGCAPNTRPAEPATPTSSSSQSTSAVRVLPRFLRFGRAWRASL